MVACKTKFFMHSESGASMLEVLLALAIVAMAAPFLYSITHCAILQPRTRLLNCAGLL